MNNPIVGFIVTVGIVCLLVIGSEFHAKFSAPISKLTVLERVQADQQVRRFA